MLSYYLDCKKCNTETIPLISYSLAGSPVICKSCNRVAGLLDDFSLKYNSEIDGLLMKKST